MAAYLRVAALDDVAGDLVEVPSGYLTEGPLRGLGFAWVEPESGGSGRLLALTERETARPGCARIAVTTADALNVRDSDVVRLRPPSKRELRRRRPSRMPVYSSVAGALAIPAGAWMSTTLTGWRLLAVLACWLLVLLATVIRWRRQ